ISRSYDFPSSGVVATSTSDGEGRFRFSGVAPGAYSVGAGTRGPIPAVAVDVPERTSRVDVTIPVPDLFVDGIVLGPDGPPEGDLRISATTAGIEPATSAVPGDDGTFRLGPLWPGTVTLTVIPEDDSLLAPASLTVEAGAQGVVVRLGRAAVVRGTVRDEATRLPIAGTLLVRLGFAPDWSSAAMVGDDGTFVVDGLPAGEVRLAAAAGDRIGLGPTLELRAGEERTGVELLVRPGATLVVEHFAEAPVLTLKVTAGDHLLGYEFRNPVGRASFPVPADEDVTVTASVLGAERRRTVRIEAGDRETVSFRFDLEDDAAEDGR
ncbi:MAG: carboxypeptidase-like regulatory domain-containing protein, partial [Planctomycetota bacterium JB042]